MLVDRKYFYYYLDDDNNYSQQNSNSFIKIETIRIVHAAHIMLYKKLLRRKHDLYILAYNIQCSYNSYKYVKNQMTINDALKIVYSVVKFIKYSEYFTDSCYFDKWQNYLKENFYKYYQFEQKPISQYIPFTHKYKQPQLIKDLLNADFELFRDICYKYRIFINKYEKDILFYHKNISWTKINKSIVVSSDILKIITDLEKNEEQFLNAGFIGYPRITFDLRDNNLTIDVFKNTTDDTHVQIVNTKVHSNYPLSLVNRLLRDNVLKIHSFIACPVCGEKNKYRFDHDKTGQLKTFTCYGCNYVHIFNNK